MEFFYDTFYRIYIDKIFTNFKKLLNFKKFFHIFEKTWL